jgi:hypothetical protein
MWLDGIVGALGAGAVAVSLLLGPALEVTEGHVAAALTNLAHPVADVVLLALLVGVSAMLGVRRERTLLPVGAAIAANRAGDIVYLGLATAGAYVEGGPLDLAWLAAMALFALAASGSDPDTVRASSQASAQSAHHGGAADGARRGRPAAGPPPAAGGPRRRPRRRRRGPRPLAAPRPWPALPADQLPTAEQVGPLRPLARVVLELSLDAAGRWWPERHVPVSVNLSAADVTDLDLPAKVARALARHGLPAAALPSSWSRTPSWPTPSGAAPCSGSCAGSVSGRRSTTTAPATARWPTCATCRPTSSSSTGASPRTWVGTPRPRRSSGTPSRFAHDLGLTLVAEGVEDAGTGAVLAGLGCDTAQGYAIARPMPVEAFVGWLGVPVAVQPR